MGCCGAKSAVRGQDCPPEYKTKRRDMPDVGCRAIPFSQLKKLAQFVRDRLEIVAMKDDDPASPSFGELLTWENITMRSVHRRFVSELTKPHACSFVELVSKDARAPPAWCVVHWWGQRFQDVLSLLTHHARTRDLPFTTPYWICELALSHDESHSCSGISLGSWSQAVQHAPFAQALRASGCCGSVLIVDGDCKVLCQTWPLWHAYLGASTSKHQLFDICATIPERSQRHEHGIVASGPALLKDLGGGQLQTIVLPDHGRFPQKVTLVGSWASIHRSESDDPKSSAKLLHCIAQSKDFEAEPPAQGDAYTAVNMAIRSLFRPVAICQAAATGEANHLQEVLSSELGALPMLDGLTALGSAAQGRHKTCLRLLLESRADANQVASAEGGATALFIASALDSIPCMKVLLDAGADPSMARASDGNTPAHVASERNALGSLQTLLEARADINRPNAKTGATPVHSAAEHDSQDCMQFLLTCQGDPNLAMKAVNQGATPLHVAAKSGSGFCLQLLLAANGDVSCERLGDGGTPALVAMERGDKVCVRILLDAGSNPNIVRSTDGATLVFLAVELDAPSCLKLVLDAKADPNTPSSTNGFTPALVCAKINALACARLLQNAKADFNQASKNGSLPLDIAEQHGYREFAEVLRSGGAFGTKFETTRPPRDSGIKVTVAGAKNLRIADLSGMADPYVICEAIFASAPQKRPKFETPVVKGTTAPVWDFTFRIPEFTDADSLKFTLWDKDAWKQDDLLGTVILKPDQMYPSGFEGDLPLSKARDKKGMLSTLQLTIAVLGGDEKEKGDNRVSLRSAGSVENAIVRHPRRSR